MIGRGERTDRWEISKAFTLTEMLAVIAIISIMSMIATPYLMRYQEKQRIKSTLRTIMYIFINARMTAYKAHSAVVITFDDKRCLAFIDNGAGKDGIAKDWLRQAGEEVVDEFIAAPGITLSNNFPKKDMFRFRNRVGITAGTVTVLYHGKPVGKVVVNIVGRTRIEVF